MTTSFLRPGSSNSLISSRSDASGTTPSTAPSDDGLQDPVIPLGTKRYILLCVNSWCPPYNPHTYQCDINWRRRSPVSQNQGGIHSATWEEYEECLHCGKDHAIYQAAQLTVPEMWFKSTNLTSLNSYFVTNPGNVWATSRRTQYRPEMRLSTPNTPSNPARLVLANYRSCHIYSYIHALLSRAR